MYSFRCQSENDGESLSLKIESWFTPKSKENINYKSYIAKLQKKIKQMTYSIKNLVGCDENYIIDLDMRASGIKYGKNSYMCINIMLFYEDDIEEVFYLSMLNDLLNEDDYFMFFETKEGA